MKLVDNTGLKRYSEHLLKTNKVVPMTCSSTNITTAANVLCNYVSTAVSNNISKLYNINNATIILKDTQNNDRGVASYIGNGAATKAKTVGYVDAYVFDSSNGRQQVKIIINNGTITRIL